MRYLTKKWYIACQTDPMTPEVQKRLDEIDRAYCAAQTRETLPEGYTCPLCGVGADKFVREE